ncbi:MAG: MFS transporter [Solirubrobacteraceae bacterium]
MRWGVLRHRSFARLFAGQAVSSLGDRLVPVALAFAVLDLTGSVTDLGLVIAAQTAPLLLFVLIGGVWADRLPRQRLMMGSDVVRAAAQGLSAAIVLNGSARIGELAALQAIYGTAEAFFGPASRVVVAQTVDRADLQEANALIGLSAELTSVAGPALAGVIVVAASAGWALAIDAATFVVSAICLALLRVKPVVAAQRTSTFAELRAGWRTFRSRTWLWATVLFFTLFIGFVFAPWQVLAPQISRTSLGGAGAWAAINAAVGLGSIGGALIGLRWRPRHPLRAALLLFFVGGPALYVLVAAHAPLPVILPIAVIDGSSGTVFNTLWYTAIQREVPPGELSRVTSWDYLGTLALQPLGLALTGPIAGAIGVSEALYVAAGVWVVLLAAVLAVPAVRNFTGDPGPSVPA